MELNPAHIVSVIDCSADTLRSVVAHLQASTDFEHLVYREAELDAIWSITGFLLKDHAEPATARLHEIAHAAHDLVAERRPQEAAAVLRSFL